MMFFIFSATLGFLTLPFSMIAELYPQQSRGLGAGITICAGYFMSFINIKAYPQMVENLGSFVIFLFYSFVSILGVFFVHFILIETKGKTLEEIEIHFREKKKPQTDVETVTNQ